jgi:hypothetical protein
MDPAELNIGRALVGLTKHGSLKYLLLHRTIIFRIVRIQQEGP